jgi:hypothetical protein
MRFTILAISGLLLTSPLLTHAQRSESAPTSRFYVSLAAYVSNYLPVWQTGSLLPVQLTAGYQFTPRLAVQASVAYNGRSNSYAGTSYDEAGSQPLSSYSYTGQYRQRVASTSVLARYTLTRQATNRWQFDAVGGLALVHTNYASSYVRTGGTIGTRIEMSDYRTNNLLPTVGLGARYRILSQVQATSNVLLGLPVTGYGAREISPSVSLGLQYQFGVK